jgi:ATP-dependent exoDNAse (exonuclease V) alpha subunit
MVFYTHNEFYSRRELNKLSIIELKNHLNDFDYKLNLFLTKKQVINFITDTKEYKYYKKLYNEVIEKVDSSLLEEQQKIFISIFSFLTGIREKNDILNLLNNRFNNDLSKLILSYINYYDYPINNNKIGLLLGGAGTGKTFLVSNIISKLLFISDSNSIQILAPTNKALKVMKEKIKKTNSNILHFSTISKFLQQDIQYTDDGKTKYKTRIDIEKNNYSRIRYLIIDEASMISEKNWNDLNTYVISRLPHIKVLLIGDECQLPPVKEDKSIVFEKNYQKFVLNEIIRSKSNQLTQIYNLYRNSIKLKKIAVVKNNISKISRYFKKSDFKYVKKFNLKKFNISKDKIISYSNKSVDNYNNLVRNTFFNNPKEKFVIGENLIFGSSIKLTSLNNGFLKDKKYYYSNDEIIVKKVDKIEININSLINNKFIPLKQFFPEKKFELYKLTVANDFKNIEIIYNVTNKDFVKFKKYFEDVYINLKKYIDKNKRKKNFISFLWDSYYIIKNTIHTPVKYSYALTVYKSQGSTFRKVFIDQENIQYCIKDMTILNKTLYTAITRASHKIKCYIKNKNDYYVKDMEQFPFLKNKIKIDNHRLKVVLLKGYKITYTRNGFNTNKRKIVTATVISNLDKIIVGNNDFEWELKIGNDMNFYL